MTFTILLLNTRKIFCLNHACAHETYFERLDFITPKGSKTKRLVDKILVTSVKVSSDCNQRAQTDGFAEQNGRDAERADLTCRY